MEETDSICQDSSGSNDSNMETSVSELTLPTVTDLSFHDIQTGESHSPTTKQHLQTIFQSIRKGEACIVIDKKGRPTVQYQDERQLYWDGPNANMIAVPKTDNDIKICMDSCLEMIDYIKTKKNRSGVVLDKTKVVTKGGKYREDYEFVKIKKVLDSGQSRGIAVIKDNTTGKEMVQKTIMIAEFRKEEVKAWVDLAETGFPPTLFLFKVEGNKVELYMEAITEAKTLRKIIDEYMRRMDASLTKQFSLYVLDGLLEAARAIHDKGWAHGDLHADNVMLQKHSGSKLRVRILDFGKAQSLDGPKGLQYDDFRGDIKEIVRRFSALYCGHEFDNALDLQRNWHAELNEVNLATDDKAELFCLIDSAMRILVPQQVPELHKLVREKLNSALPDEQSLDDMMKTVINILFPNVKDFRAIHDDPKEKRSQDSCQVDVSHTVVQEHPHSTGVKDLDVAERQVLPGPSMPVLLLEQIRLSHSIRKT